MNEAMFRKLTKALGDFAQMLQQDLDLKNHPNLDLDRTMIFYKVREISGFLEGMYRITDAIENPGKVHATFKPKVIEEI